MAVSVFSTVEHCDVFGHLRLGPEVSLLHKIHGERCANNDKVNFEACHKVFTGTNLARETAVKRGNRTANLRPVRANPANEGPPARALGHSTGQP